jgi:hypothetical protein
MNGHLSDRWARFGRRASGTLSFDPRMAQPFGIWSRLAAAICPLAFSSGRRVGDCPRSGKETGIAWVSVFGSWGLSHYERLGNRAVSYDGRLIGNG